MTTASERLWVQLEERYPIGPVRQATALTGGEWKRLWRLECRDGAYVAAICHPTTTVASVAYEHRLLRELQAQLPQIPAPLVACDGSTYFVDEGQISTLLPLMPGTMAEDTETAPAAARFLAHFQAVGLSLADPGPRPGVPAWREWNWYADDWPQIAAMLATKPSATDTVGRRFWQSCGEWAAEIAARRRQIGEERAHFQRWIADLGKTAPPTMGLVHDDYHGNNLLFADNTITALLDWDNCHPDWLLFDLSNAMWEFCHDDATHSLVVSDAQHFLQEYVDADGPLPAPEFALIVSFIRCRRMIEILGSLR
ncbi:MAG: phosphotransferase, partial [Caldilineaceae bacterium]|nr:phosphotransferase [Caldilineaceae bacterium]